MNYFTMPGIKSTFRHGAGPKLNRDVVVKTICEYFKVTLAQLKSIRKDRVISYPRQLAFYYLFHYAGMNKVELGKFLKRDHTTVLHSIRKVKDWMDVDSAIREQVSDIMNNIIDNHPKLDNARTTGVQ